MKRCWLVSLTAAALVAAMASHAAEPAASAPAPVKPPPMTPPSAQLVKKTSDAPAKPAALPASAVRNWADVDTNKDGSISADEMAAYLKANPGPQHGE